ncbi:mucin-5AC [Hippocampus zosterae]|uniref:mucin-5AC n=1 Tax=Hippocampus zosterae TaxID=109293 RepID=UPI00223CD443|nr:mucin-5AC [Hippocampus zosterae]
MTTLTTRDAATMGNVTTTGGVTTTGRSTTTTNATATGFATTIGLAATTSADTTTVGLTTVKVTTTTSNGTTIFGATTTRGVSATSGTTTPTTRDAATTRALTTTGGATVTTTTPASATTKQRNASSTTVVVTSPKTTVVVATSSSTTPATTTTATTTTTSRSPRPVVAVVVVVVAIVFEPFVPELADPNSPQFSLLAQRILLVYDFIYRRTYTTYRRCVVRGFRRAVGRLRVDNTEAEVDIEFNDNTTTGESIPSAANVAETLREAVSDPNYNFTLIFDEESIQAAVRVTTTVAPVTRVTPAEALTLRRVMFRSVGEQFTNDLLDSSSAAFIRRASTVETTLDPFYRREFTSFRTLEVISFRNGSIITNMDLSFVFGSVPNNSAIARVLVDAAAIITAFDVDTSFIFVNGEQVSSGTMHKTTMFSACCLVLLSWLLAKQQ